MIDFFNEILDTIKQNKLRAAMTGFSVAWGIFMLTVLLGAGKGLQHGVEKGFSGSSSTAIWINPGVTQNAFQGIEAGRSIEFFNEDYKILRREFAEIKSISGRYIVPGQTSFNQEYGYYQVEGVMPEFNKIVNLDQQEGRFVNELDLQENRKIAVISKPVKLSLFKEANALGQYIKIGSISYLVVGVLENSANSMEEIIYLPLSTAQKACSAGNALSNICVNSNATTVEASKKLEARIKGFFASKNQFDPADPTAVDIVDNIEDVVTTQGVTKGIETFILIIGTMTLIGGVMGVSNIMIVMVNERKKEIGVRKALGASPWSIIMLVLSESVFITLISGFLGLVTGIALLVGISMMLVNVAQNGFKDIVYIFYNPTADVGIAVSALMALVIAGLIAGYIPASNAASIKPIEALRDE